MSEIPRESLHAVVVEEELQFSLDELGHACRVERAQLVALVEEGVLTPSGDEPEGWRFAGPSLGRARSALRLARDLELGPEGTALVMDLLDQIEDLRSRLRRAGLR
jgi:chaperone modulatory protein CbpM